MTENPYVTEPPVPAVHTTVRPIAWSQRDAPRRAPFLASPTLTGLRTTGRMVSYTGADTWYPSWGADDKLYTPWTDGEAGGLEATSLGVGATTGFAVVRGSDPTALEFESLGVLTASSLPYGGRYPSASLHLDGVWYYGTYCLEDGGRGLNWDVLGPFVGFRTSVDGGSSWDEGPHTPATPLFGESGLGGQPVRFGAPHFVDFGKNMQHSPDGYAYLVGHGSATSAEHSSWISGDAVFVARVRPSLETINDPDAWEFGGGVDAAGDPIWVRDVAQSRPIASWPAHMGCVTVTYWPRKGKYLMCFTDGWPTIKEMDSYVLEADSLMGPWKMVAAMPEFGKQAYFLTLPSRFLSDESADADTVWLSYSANFTSHMQHPQIEVDPPGSRYSWCLLELDFSTRDPLTGQENP